MARTRVEVWEVEDYDPKIHGKVPPKPVKMNPQPLGAVDGKLSSDEARRNAKTILEELGHPVRSVNVSTDGKLLCYVRKVEKKPARRDRPAGVRPNVK